MKTSKLHSTLATMTLALSLSFAGSSQAKEADKLPNYVPVLLTCPPDLDGYLREKKDPRRPVPTSTFKNQRTLKVGTMTVELKRGRWHSPEGDLFIYLPGRKFLLAIDTLAAGHVPFMDFDLSTNMHA